MMENGGPERLPKTAKAWETNMPLHLSIDYTEGDKNSYRGVVLSSGRMEMMRWMTGNPEADWAAYLAWAKAEKPVVLQSSSITHFLWDVPGWRTIEDADGYEVLVAEDRPNILAEEAADAAAES
jgi:hypothetical protein